VTGGLLYFVGAFFHPRDPTMAEMLVQPAWVPAHSTVFVGLALMTAGLLAFRRDRVLSPTMARWLKWSIVLSALETLEMGVHTLAYVDAGALPAGHLHGGMDTPVLTLHVVLSIAVYTPYAIALAGLIWVAQRERTLGSPWIGWLGFVGAAAHGSVMWLAIILAIGWARMLFPIAALALSLWFILAGLWPTPARR
jgi:hypothetical protein